MPEVCRLIVYEAARPMASSGAVGRARHWLTPLLPGVPIGGGTVGNFAELNRHRPPPGTMDVVAYPVNPQVHATDDLTLMENAACHGDTVRTARSFAGGAHIAVGPVTLHRRADPFAAGKGGDGDEAIAADPRQRLVTAAAWTFASVKSLADAGADSVTYYDVTGPFGVMDEAGVFPIYNVLMFLGSDVGRELTGWRRRAPF